MAFAIENGKLSSRVHIMILYAISNRLFFGEQRDLFACTEKWAAAGVDYIQIREKDLPQLQLRHLTEGVIRTVRQTGAPAKVLLNSDPAIAADCGADGIHFPGGFTALRLDNAIVQARRLFGKKEPVISVSSHSTSDVRIARASGATLALFAPVFQKALPGTDPLPGQGIAALTAACEVAREPSSLPALPIIALGGITLENAHECTAAGAAGVAGIRLFLGEHWRQLRKPQTGTSSIREC